MWYNLCVIVGLIAMIAAIVLGVQVFGKKKKKERLPMFLAAIALFIGTGTIAGTNSEDKTGPAQTPPPVVSQEPDRAMPTSDSQGTDDSAHTSEEPQLSYEERLALYIEEKEALARTVLADQFNLELSDFQRVGTHFEMTVFSDSAKAGDEQTPENWKETQRLFVSAQASVRDAFTDFNSPLLLHLVDSDGNILLTVSNGRITYDLYQESTPTPTPTPTPEPASTPTMIRGHSSDTIVYVSNSSSTIHSVHDCSGMKNYREMTLGEADARGYKYCPNCW